MMGISTMSSHKNFSVPTDESEILRFRRGAPPHEGWWVCSLDEHDPAMWRWWNGLDWSVPVSISMTPDQVAAAAALKTAIGITMLRRLRWNYYWPAGARVPRIDPATDIITSPNWGPVKRSQP